MSGHNYPNYVKLLIRHSFVTFLLLCVLKKICSVQPCQRGYFNLKIYNSGGEGEVISRPDVVDGNCKIGVVFIV